MNSRPAPIVECQWLPLSYLQGIDDAEIIHAVHGRCAPMVPVSASLSGSDGVGGATPLVARSSSARRLDGLLVVVQKQ
jgi:hypothetical protein